MLKRAVSMATAMLMALGTVGAALTAPAERFSVGAVTLEENVSGGNASEQPAERDESSGEVVTRKPFEKNELVKKISFDVTAAVQFTDGTMCDTLWEMSMSDTRKGSIYTLPVTDAMLERLLADNEKTFEDIKYVGFNVALSYPEDCGIKDNYEIWYTSVDQIIDVVTKDGSDYPYPGVPENGYEQVVSETVFYKEAISNIENIASFKLTFDLDRDSILMYVPEDDSSVADTDSSKADDTSSRSETSPDTLKIDANDLAKMLNYVMTVDLEFKDKTTYEITEWPYTASKEGDRIKMDLFASGEKLREALKDAGKTMEDLSYVQFGILASFPDTFTTDTPYKLEYSLGCNFDVKYSMSNSGMGKTPGTTYQNVGVKQWQMGAPIQEGTYIGELQNITASFNIDLSKARAYDPEAEESSSSKPESGSSLPDSGTSKPDDSSKPEGGKPAGEDKPEQTSALGDINGDGVLNVTDVSKLAAAVKGVKALSAAEAAVADVNNDGSVNVTDVSKLAAHVKGVKTLS